MESRGRQVRSFVRRAGRITAAQSRALRELWPVYGIELPREPLDLDEIFGRDAPRICEVGFGDGQALSTLAAKHPEVDFLGIEVHEPGVGRLLLTIEKQGLTNIRIIRHDAVEVLRDWLKPACLDRLHLFFPDPWPKKRHHKRRIVQQDFLALAARVLKPGGMLHMATDWENYAEHMLELTDSCPRFRNFAGPGHFSERPAERPETKFERRGRRLGHQVRDLLYQRTTG
jgi:tRNA (guanine-N7-)-methyltransferase